MFNDGGFAEDSSYLYTDVICLFWWESIDE